MTLFTLAPQPISRDFPKKVYLAIFTSRQMRENFLVGFSMGQFYWCFCSAEGLNNSYKKLFIYLFATQLKELTIYSTGCKKNSLNEET